MVNSTLDNDEVQRFAKISSEWWDLNGKFRPLHILGPTRLKYIHEQICTKYDRSEHSVLKFQDLSLLDIGCGGGLVAEPMARMGAQVTAIDPAQENIEAAHLHSENQGLKINYQVKRVEDLVQEGNQFDIVLLLEVIEHVPDIKAFIGLCQTLVKPGGILIISTLNRTLKSYALAIVGAEYVLRWLPVGTHQWNRFVTPDELSQAIETTGLNVVDKRGMVYHPLHEEWSLSHDMDVNYFITAEKDNLQ